MMPRNFSITFTLLLILFLPVISSLTPYSVIPSSEGETDSKQFSLQTTSSINSFTPNPMDIPPPQPGDNWTVLVYLDGDNDLEEYAFIDLNEMELVGSTADVKIIVYVDFWSGSDAPYSGAKCYEVIQDMNTNTINSIELSTSLPSEPDMGNWQTLRDFVVFGQSYAPADQYLLVLWDHGAGALGLCVDDTSGTAMDVRDVYYALNDSAVQHLDLVAFDACLMAQIEVAYELRNTTNYLVFSEEGIPLNGFPYDDILQDLTNNPSTTPPQLASQIVFFYTDAYDVGGQYYDPSFSFTCLSAVDTSQVEPVVDSLKTLAGELAALIQSPTQSSDVYNRVCQSLATTQTFSSPEFVDLGGFALGIVNLFANDSYPAIHISAYELGAAVILCVFNESHLSAVPGAKGLSIYTADYGSNPLFLASESLWDEFIEAFLDFGEHHSTACTISPTGTYYGYLDDEDDSVYFTFTPTTSAYYTITLAPAWPEYDTDFDLYIYDSSLNSLDYSISADSTEEIQIQLSAGSSYYLEVFSFPSTTDAGVFQITFYGGDGPTFPTLPFSPALLAALLGGILLAVIIAIIIAVTIKRRSIPSPPPPYGPTYTPTQPTTTPTGRFCGYCGALLPSQAQYCPTCGASTMRD
ncbi:MAG: clostripain-related cysteine peptidase [Candidatus Hodarchaeota archaeon]